MAGGEDYIPVRTSLVDDEDVFCIAQKLRMKDPDLAAGKLLRFWSWLTRVTATGRLGAYTAEYIDRKVMGVRGWCDTLMNFRGDREGWLSKDPKTGELFIPGWDEWMSKSAKARAGEAVRKQIQRGHSSGHSEAESSGQVSGQKRDQSRAEQQRAEKRREDNSEQQQEAEDPPREGAADCPRVRRPAAALSSLQGDVCSLLLQRVPDLRREDAAAMAREPLADREKVVWILERYDTERARGWKPDRGWGAWIRGMIRGAQPPPAWMETRRRQQLAEIGARARAAQAAGGTR